MESATRPTAADQVTAADPGARARPAPVAARRRAWRIDGRTIADLRATHLPHRLVVAVALGLVVAGQLVEDLSDSGPLQLLSPADSSRRWTLIAVVLYMLVIERVLERTVKRSLPSLERVLRIDERRFRAYVHRLERPDLLIGIVLLAIAALINTVLFAGLGLDLPVGDDPVTGASLYLPANPGGAFLVLAGYTVVGWAGLSLVYLTVRVGRALGALSREPLEVDVFDTTNLLPFGNIALASALAPVGIIVILLIGLGQPTTWLGLAVLVLAAIASVLALLLPLRGIHRQMSDAKEAVLVNLNARIGQVYREVDRSAADAAQPPGLDQRTNTLIPLRKTVNETTTWPFADTVAFGRAILIASAPLIYTVLSELIKVFWINPLSR